MVLRLWGEIGSGGVIYGDDILVASDGAVYLGSRKCNVFGCMALATDRAVSMLRKHRREKPLLLTAGVVVAHESAIQTVALYQSRDSLVCESKLNYWIATTPAGLVTGTYTELFERTLCDPALARQRAEAWLSNVLERIPPFDSTNRMNRPVRRHRMAQAYALFLQGQKNKLLEKIDAKYAAA